MDCGRPLLLGSTRMTSTRPQFYSGLWVQETSQLDSSSLCFRPSPSPQPPSLPKRIPGALGFLVLPPGASAVSPAPCPGPFVVVLCEALSLPGHTQSSRPRSLIWDFWPIAGLILLLSYSEKISQLHQKGFSPSLSKRHVFIPNYQCFKEIFTYISFYMNVLEFL